MVEETASDAWSTTVDLRLPAIGRAKWFLESSDFHGISVAALGDHPEHGSPAAPLRLLRLPVDPKCGVGAGTEEGVGGTEATQQIVPVRRSPCDVASSTAGSKTTGRAAALD